MVDKKNLTHCLKTMSRRVSFQSDYRVSMSLFFHCIYSTLIEMNRMNEEALEEILKKGFVKFCHFDGEKKVTVSIEIEDLNADQSETE